MANSFKLHSPEFEKLGKIPLRYTSQGANISPPLRWSGAPRETVELAMICKDPDAPFPKPFVHWILYGMPASVSAIPAGLPNKDELELPILCRQGRNSLQAVGYTGPNPPFWHSGHHYVFHLFALSKPIELWPGAGRADFYKAIEGAVIAEARMVGVYEKPAVFKALAAAQWAAGVLPTAFAVWRTWRGLSRRLKKA